MYGPKWPFLLILIIYGPGVVVVNCWDRFCTLGKALRTKESLPNFHEWCRVPTSMNIPRVDGLSTDPREIGRHKLTPQDSILYEL